MNLYRVLHDDQEEVVYHSTRAEAHLDAKSDRHRHEVRIEHVYVRCSKTELVAALNGKPAVYVEQRWRLSARGAMVLLAEGED